MICKIHSGSQEAQDASAAPGAPESKGDEELQLLDSKHVSERERLKHNELNHLP